MNRRLFVFRATFSPQALLQIAKTKIFALQRQRGVFVLDNRKKRGFLFFTSALFACVALLVMSIQDDSSATAQNGSATERISVLSDGTQGNGSSDRPWISTNGRYVAFLSAASNLVSGDTNGVADVFVRDRQTGQINRISVASDGTQANNPSDKPSISADGRFVAFVSGASNLVSGDTNNTDDIFVRDQQTGQTSRISVASNGTQGDNYSDDLAISADGRYVAFESRASNLVNNDSNGYLDIFVHDRQTGQTSRVSVASDGTQGNNPSSRPAISADGRYILFESGASNLVSGDTNGVTDVFIHDRQTGQTSRVSVASDGTQGNGNSWSYSSALSGDGRFVVFSSTASNLVSNDSNGNWDVFVRDRQTGQTSRVSVASDGLQGNGSFQPSQSVISADGRYVVFSSYANNLVSDDTNNTQDIFVHDRQMSQTNRVSVGTDGTQANNISDWPTISSDGRYVAFSSSGSNLVNGDTNGYPDVFVRDLGYGTITSCFSDEFSSLSLSSGWKWLDPLADSDYILMTNPGNLRIQTPDRDHDLNPSYNTNAPRMMQSITGNFDVTTKVTVNPIQVYQSAGLLIWFDSSNFVFIGRATNNAISMRYMRDLKEYQPPGIPNISNTTVYLRITRSLNTFSTYYSLNGSDWILTGSIDYPAAPSTPSVGLFVLNNWQDNLLSADFDYFHCGGAISSDREPVIFLNGMAGSELRLFDNNSIIWPSLFTVSKMPLSLKPGNSSHIYVSDAIRHFEVTYHGRTVYAPVVYESFINRLTNRGQNGGGYTEYVAGNSPHTQCDPNQQPTANLYVYAWDWRYGVVSVADSQYNPSVEQMTALKSYLDCVLQRHPGQKINLVAHSMGGMYSLLFWLKNQGYPIDNVITMGTPWLGAPKSIYMMLNGDFMWELLPATETKALLHYFPGTHQLLPAAVYDAHAPIRVLSVLDTTDLSAPAHHNVPIAYQDLEDTLQKQYTPQSTIPFVENNKVVFDTPGFTDWNRAASSVQFHVLYGQQWSDNTVIQTKQTIRRQCYTMPPSLIPVCSPLFIDFVPVMGQGDGTVPVVSAGWPGQSDHSPNVHIHRFAWRLSQLNESLEHQRLPGNQRIQDCVLSILQPSKGYNCDDDTQISAAEVSTNPQPRHIEIFGANFISLTDGITVSGNLLESGEFLTAFPSLSIIHINDASVHLVIPSDVPYSIMVQPGNQGVMIQNKLGLDVQPIEIRRYDGLSNAAIDAFIITNEANNATQLAQDVNQDGKGDVIITPIAVITGSATLDSQPPTIAIGYDSNSKTAIISAIDEQSGVSRIFYSFDGLNYLLYQQPVAVTLSVSKVYAQAEDKVGNMSNIKTLDISLPPPPIPHIYLPIVSR